MAEHTGQSSQLAPVANGRNAQFLGTVASSASGNVSLNRAIVAEPNLVGWRDPPRRFNASLCAGD